MIERPARPAVVIAAGGNGTRIGGAKAERLLGGRRLIDHAIDWALRQSDAVALATAPGSSLEAAGLPCLVDQSAEIGPIAALASAMRFAAELGRPRVMLVACDTPFLPDDLVNRLGAALGESGAALPRWASRLHPLAGLWTTEPVGVTAWIDGGGRSLWGYAEHAGLVMVDWPAEGADPFANINTVSDLAAAEARLTAPGR